MMTEKKRYQEPAPAIDVEEFRKVVMSRRSVRKFDETPVPAAVLDDCIDMALLAPNSSNLQPWEFHVVKTPALQKELMEACLNQNAATSAKALVAIVARLDTWREHSDMMLDAWPLETAMPKIVDNYYRKFAKIHYSQGPFNALGLGKRAFYSLAGLKRPVPRGPFTHADMRVWAAKTVALASENFMLAMRAHGFDTCPMEGFDENRVRRLLKLQGDCFVVMVIGCGKRAKDGIYHPRIRFARDRFVREH